jgi:hypothetical protein
VQEKKEAMSSQNPVGGIPDPYEKYRVEGLGEKHTPGEGFSGEEPPKDKTGLAARLVQALQRAVDSFLEKLGGSPSREAATETQLKSLKALFEMLRC